METRATCHIHSRAAMRGEHGMRHATSVYISTETWPQIVSQASCWDDSRQTTNTGIVRGTRDTGSDCSEIRSWRVSQVCALSLIHGCAAVLWRFWLGGRKGIRPVKIDFQPDLFHRMCHFYVGILLEYESDKEHVLFVLTLWNRAGHYIFALWFLSSFFFFLFPSPNFSGRRLDVCHTSTYGVALVRT